MIHHEAEIDACGVHSSEGDELGTTGSTVTDLTVLDGLVGHGVLTEVLADHFSLDIDGSPVLARVNLANGADHLGHDDSITQVGLDGLGLLTVGGVLDGELELFDKSVVLGVDLLELGVQSPPLSRLEKSDDLVLAHLEELIELDTSVDLLLEWLSFLGLGTSSLSFRHLQLTVEVTDIK